MAENVGALALFYRKRAASVVRIALLAGGLACTLFGALFLYFAFLGGDLVIEVASAATWMAVGVGALQIRHWMLRAGRGSGNA